MKTIISENWGRISTTYKLEVSDFKHLEKEFTIDEDILGINLTSKINKRLSIHIGQYEIKYDQDVSFLRMMIATHRVYNRVSLLETFGDNPPDYMQYIPRTTEKLITLIDEFKYKGMNNVTPEEIVEFLK